MSVERKQGDPFHEQQALSRTAHRSICGVFSWAFILDEVNENATRLVLRTRARGGPRPFMLLNSLLFPPADFLVARLMLRTIKQRAERQAFVGSSLEEKPPAALAAGEPMGSGKVER